MPDAAQVKTDVDFLTSQPGWKDAAGRRDYIRNVAVKSLQDDTMDPAHHAAVIGELWNRSDERGILKQGADFVGRSTKEIALSVPAAAGALALGVMDATGVTDTGSGKRLKRGVVDLVDAAGQRIKSLHPDDRQEQRDTALDALKKDLDARAYPAGLEAWLAGATDGSDADLETQQWIQGLTWGLGRKAVAADHAGAVTPERLNGWIQSDRNPMRKDSDTGEPGPKAYLGDYLVTRDPASWAAFKARVSETDSQLTTRLKRFANEGQLQEGYRRHPQGWVNDIAHRSADFQTSPIDIATTVLPFLKGAKAFKAAKAGSKAAAVLEAAKGVGIEAGSEGLTEALQDPNAPTSQILEAAAMGATGAAVLTGGATVAGAAVNKLVTPTRTLNGTESMQVPDSKQVSVDINNATEGATDAEFKAAEASPGVLAQMAAATATEQPAPTTKEGSTPSVPETQAVSSPESPLATPTPQEPLAQPSAEAPPLFSWAQLKSVAEANGVPVEQGMTVPKLMEAIREKVASATEGGGFTNTAIPPRTAAGFVQLPAEFKGALDHGVNLIRNGVHDFAQWSVEMVKKFGKAISDYLKDVWAAMMRTSETGAVQLGGTVEKAAEQETSGSTLPPGEHAPEEGEATETRKFGARVAQDPRMNPKVQAQAAQQYVPIANVETLDQANVIIDQMGLEGAVNAVRDAGSPMPPHVRVALGMQAMLRLDQQARALRNAGDLAGAAALWQQTGELGHFVDTLGTTAGRAVQAFAMWTRLTPEGVLTTFEKKVREVNKGEMPALPPETLTKLNDLRDKINGLPENSPLRADMMREMMSELALYQGIPLSSVFASLWYANLLSGITTQGMNVIGNGFGLFLRTVAAGLASHPSDTLRMIGGYLRGLPRAWNEAKAALKGKVDSRNAQDVPTVDQVTKRNALEVMLSRPPSDFKSWVAWVGSLGGLTKYVTRALTGMDAAFYYTAAEGRAHLAASRAARQGFTPGTPEFVQAMASQLGLGAGAWEKALAEAERQLKTAGKPVTMTDKKRIAYKIIDDSRSSAIKEEAARFGELVTSQQEPDGFGKWVYDGIRHFQRLPIVGRALLPFARTLANLASNAADFTPVGVVRGIKGKHLINGKEEFSSAERRERAMAGAIGTAVFGFILSKAWDHKDEDDESTDFMIYAGGPLSKGRRDQMPKGWRPYTVKIGKHYWSYAETPLVFALAPAGAIMDSKRYHNMDDRSLDVRTQYYVQAVLKTTTSQGVLSSMGDFMGVLNGDVPLSKLPSRFTGGMIPAQGFLRDVTGFFDPVKISDDTVAASILRDVPVLRHIYGKPALDYMGDPITYEGLSRIPIMKRFVADQRSEDRDKAWVGQMKLSIPAFPKVVEVGDYLTKGERVAAKAARVDAGMLTQDEQYAFIKRAGQITREQVKGMRLNYEASKRDGSPVADREAYQRAINARVEAARKIAMRELIMGIIYLTHLLFVL